MLKWVPGYLAHVGLSSPAPSIFIELPNRIIKLLLVDVRVDAGVESRIQWTFHVLEELPATNGLFLLRLFVEEIF